MVAPDPDNTQELREAAHAYLAAFPVACPQADRLRKALTDNTQDIGEGVRQLRDELRHARLDTPQAFYVWVNQLRNEIEDRLTALLQPSGDTEQAACDYCQDIPEACNGNDCPSEQQVTEGESLADRIAKLSVSDGHQLWRKRLCEEVAQAQAEKAEVERERDQWKRAANGDRDGVLTYEHHLHVVKALVAERKEAEARIEQVATELERRADQYDTVRSASMAMAYREAAALIRRNPQEDE